MSQPFVDPTDPPDSDAGPPVVSYSQFSAATQRSWSAACAAMEQAL